MESNKIPPQRHPKGFGHCGSGRALFFTPAQPRSPLCRVGMALPCPEHSPPWLLGVLLLGVGFQRGIDLLPQGFHFRGAGQTLGIWSREKIQVGKEFLQRGGLSMVCTGRRGLTPSLIVNPGTGTNLALPGGWNDRILEEPSNPKHAICLQP